MKITNVYAQEIFDSRGIPTIECFLDLDDGTTVTASVPSGISRGSHEAHELRDGGDRLMGLGVQSAVHIIDTIIAPVILGRHPAVIDMDVDMIELDNTATKSKLGANTMLAVSIALCKAQAHSESLPVYELVAQLCGLEEVSLPVPMFNMLEGGLHTNNIASIQEFMIVPTATVSFSDAMEVGITIFHSLQELLKAKGMFGGYGYEGGCIPLFKNPFQACDLLMEAIEKSHNTHNAMIAIDVAASHFYSAETGLYVWDGAHVPGDYLIEWYKKLIDAYPLYSIEDGLSEFDWNNWAIMKHDLGQRVKIIGDDIFATNPQRIWNGIERDCATVAIIKPNQIGTITESLQAVNLCKENGWDVVVSHRSGETNDFFIADLAVGVSASHIKAGGPSRGERLAKYNRLLCIENELLDNQIFF